MGVPRIAQNRTLFGIANYEFSKLEKIKLSLTALDELWIYGGLDNI